MYNRMTLLIMQAWKAMTGCDSYVKDGWVLAMKIHYFRQSLHSDGKGMLHTCMYYTSLTVMSQLR